MTVLTGKVCGFWTEHGASIPVTAEGMTRVGTTNEFYITTRSKMWWDPAASAVFKVNGSPVAVTNIDYGIGYVTLTSYTSGTVTCDVSYFAMEALGGGHGWKIDLKCDTKDVTVFPSALNTSTTYKQYANTLRDFSGSLDRYWVVTNASWSDAQGSDKDLTWTWNSGGTIGNGKSIEYIVSGSGTALDVSYAANKITVTCATTVGGDADSTANQILAHAMADPVIAALVTCTLKTGSAGTGKPGAVTAVAFTGGRDPAEIIAKMAGKVLMVFYIDVTTGSKRYFAGVGNLSGMSVTADVSGVCESNLSFSGSGRVRYHAEG